MSIQPHYHGGYEHTQDPGEPSTGAPRVSITDEEAAILAIRATGLRVLEIGTGLGVSTRALAATATEVVTVDIDAWVHATIWPTLPANVTTAKALADVTGSFDLAFIDGDHTTEAVAADIAAAEALVKSGGQLITHDTNFGHVRDALGPGWTDLPTHFGLSVREVVK